MLFHEMYGSYYGTVSAILNEAVEGSLTPKSLHAIVAKKAFGESGLTIPTALQDGTWPLLTPQLTTPLTQPPTRPLSTLEKRWLKALLSDPRIALFAPSADGLDDVEPLHDSDIFAYFDRYSDGDPYEDDEYIAYFCTILTALRERRRLCIHFQGHRGGSHRVQCIPLKLEYSSKDDKFRLVTQVARKITTINVARITDCVLGEAFAHEEIAPNVSKQKTLVLDVHDQRNALERAMLHFSHLEKETSKVGEDHYTLTLHYDSDDETELLIRVLSFGPLVRVIEPTEFIEKIRQRIEAQKKLRT